MTVPPGKPSIVLILLNPLDPPSYVLWNIKIYSKAKQLNPTSFMILGFSESKDSSVFCGTAGATAISLVQTQGTQPLDHLPNQKSECCLLWGQKLEIRAIPENQRHESSIHG